MILGQSTGLALITNIMKTNFQGESKRSGDSFENIVEQSIKKDATIVQKNFYIDEAGCEVDFVINQNNKIIYVECKGGETGNAKRPGAQRTDNVKKAIANGALIKSVMPDSIYVVYFSAPPTAGSSSDKMLQLALSQSFIDEIVFLSDTKIAKPPTLW